MYLVSSHCTDEKKAGDVHVNVTLRRVHPTIFDFENPYAFHILSVSLALLMQHARLPRRIILSIVACLAVLYFSTLSHKRQDFREKKCIEIKVRVLIFFTTFVVSNTSIPRSTERDIVINVHRSSRKVLIIVRF